VRRLAEPATCLSDSHRRSNSLKGGCRRVIDIDEAAAVELARHVRTTNAQVAGQHRVALREHTGVLAALGGGYRGDGHGDVHE